MSSIVPKPKPSIPPPPPPTAPTAADSSVVAAGQAVERSPFTSLISTTPQGLQRKASTGKTTLIGGN